MDKIICNCFHIKIFNKYNINNIINQMRKTIYNKKIMNNTNS